MTPPVSLPPVNLDHHKEKSSSIWQCSCIKSNCCSTVNAHEDQDAELGVEVITQAQGTEAKTEEAAKRCCVIL